MRFLISNSEVQSTVAAKECQNYFASTFFPSEKDLNLSNGRLGKKIQYCPHQPNHKHGSLHREARRGEARRGDGGASLHAAQSTAASASGANLSPALPG